MNYTTLISAETLNQQLNNSNWVIVDCRFSLADTEAGAKAYRHGHIPNARYAHLDKDLSSAITDFTGRHPLPDFALLAKKLGQLGHNQQPARLLLMTMQEALLQAVSGGYCVAWGMTRLPYWMAASSNGKNSDFPSPQPCPL